MDNDFARVVGPDIRHGQLFDEHFTMPICGRVYAEESVIHLDILMKCVEYFVKLRTRRFTKKPARQHLEMNSSCCRGMLEIGRASCRERVF